MAIICDELNISMGMVLENIKSRTVFKPRFYLVYIATEFGLPWAEVARYMGYDHQILRRQKVNMQQRMVKYPAEKEQIELITERFKEVYGKDESFKTTKGLLNNGYLVVKEKEFTELCQEYAVIRWRDRNKYTDVMRKVIYEDILK